VTLAKLPFGSPQNGVQQCESVALALGELQLFLDLTHGIRRTSECTADVVAQQFG
jgi:hypothetical protein